MIAAELRGGSKPSLEEALGWIGSRVDDIYGANVGRLEDVWIDPDSGLPRWLLVKGRFSGRTTLIPFDHATAGAGHVWVPYEREVVRDAPEVQAGVRPTAAVEAALFTHYARRAPGEAIGAAVPEPRVPHVESRPVARPRGRQVQREQPRPTGQPQTPAYRPIPRPAAPEQHPAYRAQPPPPEPPRGPFTPAVEPAATEGGWPGRHAQPQDHDAWQAPREPAPTQQSRPAEHGGWAVGSAPPAYGTETPQQPPAPQPSPAEIVQDLVSSAEASDIEIDIKGKVTISGELIQIRITPRP